MHAWKIKCGLTVFSGYKLSSRPLLVLLQQLQDYCPRFPQPNIFHLKKHTNTHVSSFLIVDNNNFTGKCPSIKCWKKYIYFLSLRCLYIFVSCYISSKSNYSFIIFKVKVEVRQVSVLMISCDWICHVIHLYLISSPCQVAQEESPCITDQLSPTHTPRLAAWLALR